jgi:hypothetical protein
VDAVAGRDLEDVFELGSVRWRRLGASEGGCADVLEEPFESARCDEDQGTRRVDTQIGERVQDATGEVYEVPAAACTVSWSALILRVPASR